MAGTDSLARAEFHLDAGQYGPARELVEGVLRQDPHSGAAHLLMARVQVSTGDLLGAEQSARLAMAIPEARAPGLFVLSRVVGLDPRRAGEALDAATEAVRLDPNEWRYRDLLGERLVDVRDFPNAIAQAEIAVRLAPEDPDEKATALRGLAQVSLNVPGHGWRAYQAAHQAVALDPTNPAGHQMLAAVQLGLQQHSKAVFSSLAVLRDDPTAVLPPTLLTFALYFLVRRTLGFMLLAAWMVPMLAIGVGSNIVDIETQNALLGRVGGALGIVLFALVVLLVFRPIAQPSVRRAVWRTGRKLGWFRMDLVFVALALLGYLLALGPGWLLAIPPVAFLMIIAWIAHGVAARSLRFPEPMELIKPRG